MRIAGEERWIAAEDAGLYRDALGVPPPGGLPDAYLEPVDDAMAALVRRYARTHGPFPTAQITRRYGLDVTPALKQLERGGELVRGELLPGGTEREWCDADVLRRVRRASVAALRQEVEAVDPAELARFLPAWQNVDAHRPAGAGPDRLREALIPLQGVALTPEVWERDVLPAPARRLQPDLARPADHERRAGLDRRRGARPAPGAWRSTSARTSASPARHRRTRSSSAPRARSTTRSASGSAPRPRSGSTWSPSSTSSARSCTPRSGTWSGRARSPTTRSPRCAPAGLGRGRRDRRPARRFASRRTPAQEAIVGRWSTTEALFRNAPAAGPRLRAQAELMLERYGIVTRETVLAEGVPGGFSSLYGELSNLEMLGTARRGYFVEGLGGAQFALAGAVERLRGLPQRDDEYLILAATDPAQPYGATLRWPKRAEGRRPARTPGAFVLLRDGNPIVYVERGGKGIVRLVELEGERLVEAISRIAEAARDEVIPKLGIERVDGEPVFGSGLEEQIIAAGFSRQPRKLVAAS